MLYAFCNTSSKKKRTGLGGGGAVFSFRAACYVRSKQDCEPSTVSVGEKIEAARKSDG